MKSHNPYPLCLLSFTWQMFPRCIHVVACVSIHSSLLPNNTHCTHIALGLFPSVIHAAVNIHIQIFVWIYVLLATYLSMKLLDFMVTSFNFLRDCQTVEFILHQPFLLETLNPHPTLYIVPIHYKLEVTVQPHLHPLLLMLLWPHWPLFIASGIQLGFHSCSLLWILVFQSFSWLTPSLFSLLKYYLLDLN
jgi:hypothetical protein